MDDWQARISEITQSEHPEEQLLTKRDVAKLLQVSVTTVEHWARSGKLPKVTLTSRAVRFKMSEVRRLIRESSST